MYQRDDTEKRAPCRGTMRPCDFDAPCNWCPTCQARGGEPPGPGAVRIVEPGDRDGGGGARA